MWIIIIIGEIIIILIFIPHIEISAYYMHNNDNQSMTTTDFSPSFNPSSLNNINSRFIHLLNWFLKIISDRYMSFKHYLVDQYVKL